MAVDLTGLRFRVAELVPFRLGGTVRGALGGSQRIDRLGDRWQLRVETAPMRVEPEGRRWSVLLDQASREGALVRVSQPDRVTYSYGSPVVANAVASGRSVSVSGLAADAVILPGQPLSIIVGGQRYLDKARTQVVASATGTVTVQLVNLIRVPLPAGAVVELTVPKIEGSIDGDFGGAWEANRTTSFAFTVTEDA